MRRSIQWTLQLWHAGLLAVVLIGFGTAVYFGVAQSRHQQFDAEMERAVLTLMGGFRPPKPPDTAPASAPAKEPVPHDPWEAPPAAFEGPPALAGRFAPELPE